MRDPSFPSGLGLSRKMREESGFRSVSSSIYPVKIKFLMEAARIFLIHSSIIGVIDYRMNNNQNRLIMIEASTLITMVTIKTMRIPIKLQAILGTLIRRSTQTLIRTSIHILSKTPTLTRVSLRLLEREGRPQETSGI